MFRSMKNGKKCWSTSALHTVESITTSDENRQNATFPTMKKRKVLVRSIDINPTEYIECAFKANGFDVDTVRKQAQESFIPPTAEMIKAFNAELMNTVRKNDLEKLKEMYASGKLINCCNKFGESLLHLACRRGHTEIVRFFIHDVQMDLHIRDDYNRTALHDACWTVKPNYELVQMLVEQVPEYLLLKDVRGFTPFDYIRKEHRGKWLHFLWQRKEVLRPLEKTLPTSKPSSAPSDTATTSKRKAGEISPTTKESLTSTNLTVAVAT